MALENSRNAEILALRAAGETLEKIGRRFGISRQRVLQVCTGGRPVKPQARQAAMVERRRAGQTIAKIAQEAGVSWATAYKLCRGVSARDAWRARKAGALEIRVRTKLTRAIVSLEAARKASWGRPYESDIARLVESVQGVAVLLQEEDGKETRVARRES